MSIPPLLFADNTFMFSHFTNRGQREEFLEELQFIGDLTGLHINRGKTKIISLFPPEEDFHHVLLRLGEVTNELTHHGIVWSKTMEASAKATYRARLHGYRLLSLASSTLLLQTYTTEPRL